MVSNLQPLAPESSSPSSAPSCLLWLTMIETPSDDLLLSIWRWKNKQSNYAVRAWTQYTKIRLKLFSVYERRQRLSMHKSGFSIQIWNPVHLMSTVESINLRIRLIIAGQRVEVFHWNSGQLAQTGMILNNQVIAAALGLKNISLFLSRASKVCFFATLSSITVLICC